MSENLHLNFEENVIMYVIEENDNWDESQLSEEERTNLHKENDNFIMKILEPTILRTFSICNCKMQEFMERNESRRRIMNVPIQAYKPTFEQCDLDNFRYGVVLTSKDGKFDTVKFIIRQCINCGVLDFRGDVNIMTRLVTECTKNFMDAMAELQKEKEALDRAQVDTTEEHSTNVVDFPIDRVAVDTVEDSDNNE